LANDCEYLALLQRLGQERRRISTVTFSVASFVLSEGYGGAEDRLPADVTEPRDGKNEQ